MFSKILKVSMSIFFSFLILPTFLQVSAQTESFDEDFQRAKEEAEAEFEEEKARIDQQTEEMEEEVQIQIQEMDSEFEEYSEDIQERADQSEIEYEASRELMENNAKTAFGALFVGMASMLGLSALGGILSIIFYIIILILSLGGLVFDVFMIIDCLNREFEDRTIWLVVLIFGGLMGLALPVATIYYFAVKKKLDSNNEGEGNSIKEESVG